MLSQLYKKLYKRLPIPHYPYKPYMFKYKCLFIHIPKNAGSSVMSAFGDNGGRLHLPWYVYRDANPFAYRKMKKFAIVRHPSLRLFSAYQYIAKGGNGKVKDLNLQKLVTENTSNFDEFVLNFLDPHKVYQYELLKPQHTFICDELGSLQVDRLMRMESLTADWADFNAQYILNGNLHLPITNTSKSSLASRALSDEVTKKIHQLYLPDFEIFNYKVKEW